MNTVELIAKKRDGGTLSREEIEHWIAGTVGRTIPEYQSAALLMAIRLRGMTDEETAILTNVMAHSGSMFTPQDLGGFTVDKHSTGGVGDTTTLVLIPLLAAAGLTVGKLSGRALGHTGGTIDKLESIPGFRTDLPRDRFLDLVRRTRLALADHTEDMVPADRILYELRDVTATVDSLPLIVASAKIELLRGLDGIFIPYGFGSRGAEGKIRAIRFARESGIPFLGVCFGFQLAVVEFARNKCGLEDANSTEVDPETANPVIDLMPEQRGVERKGATMRLGAHKIIIKKDTLAYTLYKAEEIHERHRHRWEVNRDYWNVLQRHGLVFSGRSPDGRRIEILELQDKFFFFASQFHGEFKSRPSKPDPEYYGFVKACLDKKLGRTEAEF